MSKYYFIAFSMAGLLLASCKTSFRISVKQPAAVQVPSKYKNFGVVNNVNNTNSPDKIIENILNGAQLNGNVIASERAMDGVVNALGNSRDMSARIVESEEVHGENGALNWDVLDSLANEQELDGFIELVEFRSQAPIGGSVAANATGQTSQKLSGTLIMNVHLQDTTLRFDRLSVNGWYRVPLSGSTGILDILNDAARKREYYRKLGFTLGNQAGRLIYPNWVWVGRKYYTKGSRVLKQAKPMIAKGNWDIAEEQLMYDIDNPKRKIRGRVLYNLALVNEGQGDIDKAMEYAKRAALECGDKLSNEYLVQLRKRQREIQRMNEAP